MGCRRVGRPADLLRVHRAGGELVVGPGPGRGAWLCADHPEACLDRALKRGALGRALRAVPARDEIEHLRARLGG